jgi:hypothetical protein
MSCYIWVWLLYKLSINESKSDFGDGVLETSQSSLSGTYFGNIAITIFYRLEYFYWLVNRKNIKARPNNPKIERISPRARPGLPHTVCFPARMPYMTSHMAQLFRLWHEPLKGPTCTSEGSSTGTKCFFYLQLQHRWMLLQFWFWISKLQHPEFWFWIFNTHCRWNLYYTFRIMLNKFPLINNLNPFWQIIKCQLC